MSFPRLLALGLGVVVAALTVNLASVFTDLPQVDLFDNARLIAQESLRRGELDEQDGAALRRIEVKTRLVNQIADGRLTLRQASAEFRRLKEESGKMDQAREIFWPDLTPEEALFQEVIFWTAASLRYDPARAAPVLRSLEEQRRSEFPWRTTPPPIGPFEGAPESATTGNVSLSTPGI